eukprot:161236-Rhodomonas_salina.2
MLYPMLPVSARYLPGKRDVTVSIRLAMRGSVLFTLRGALCACASGTGGFVRIVRMIIRTRGGMIIQQGLY